MPDTKTAIRQGDACLLGYIDLLVDSGLVGREDVAMLRDKYGSCEELYSALDSLGVIDSEKLTELFAKAKGIPYVNVKSVDQKAYDMIGGETAANFAFVPFAVDEKDKILQVAIADPLRISKISQASLASLENKIGYKIEVFLTSKKVLERLPLLVDRSPDLPRVDLSSFWIDEKVLKKIPFDLAEKYKIIIFKQNGPGDYSVAVAGEANRSVLLMLEQMEKRAKIKFRLFSAAPSQLQRVLKDYKTKTDLEKNRAISQKKEEHKAALDLDRQNHDFLSSGAQTFGETGSAALQEPGMQPNLNQDISGDSSGDVKQSGLTAEKTDKLEDPDLGHVIGSEKVTPERVNQLAGQGDIPKLVASIISMAVDQEASDIHIEPFEKNVKLRYRVDGQLAEVAQFSSQIQPQIVARIKILSKLKLDEQRVPQDGRFDVRLGKELVDIRVSTLPTVFGEKVVMRLLSKTKKLDDLSDLGIEGMNFDRIIKAISKPYGVVLATGPTGSGKSTTLYSIFSRLNKPEVNIITLEDPVEYEISGINQVQVKPEIGFSFAEGLRSVLRQDPNIIMVGEIRDGETAELAVQAALTGHLVFSTLHTNDASSALPRMYNLGVEPFLLTSAINAIVAQRLVRRICIKCRQEVSLPQSIVFQVKKELEPLNLNTPLKFYSAKGCSACKNGFKGRLGIYEVLEMSKDIEDLVLDKKSSGELFTQAVKEGMITMKQDGLIKAIKGETTVDEVFRVTREQNEEG